MPFGHAIRTQDCPPLEGGHEETPHPPTYLTIVAGGGRPSGTVREDIRPHANAHAGVVRQEKLVGMSRIWLL